MDNTQFSVGDKVSFAVGSDTYPGVVVKVTPCRLEVQRSDFAGDFENGHDYFGSQKWIITENLKGKADTFTRRGKVSDGHGRFAMKGCNYSWLRHGWSARMDPSF